VSLVELEKLGKQFWDWLKGKSIILETYDHAENEVEYWNDQREACSHLPNLAMFALDADVHSSNCERLFKDFAKQHTKARSRLKQNNVDALAQVKYHLRRKYHEDYSAPSKNRLISL
jgi:hypothetical protein